jgi:hypothetical protein
MSSGSMTGKPRRDKGRFSTVEAVRALIASAALASILLLAVFVTTGSYFSADLQAKNPASKIAPLSPANGGAAAHRVASIVVETDKKGRCEETPLRQSLGQDRVGDPRRLRSAARQRTRHDPVREFER